MPLVEFGCELPNNLPKKLMLKLFVPAGLVNNGIIYDYVRLELEEL